MESSDTFVSKILRANGIPDVAPHHYEPPSQKDLDSYKTQHTVMGDAYPSSDTAAFENVYSVVSTVYRAVSTISHKVAELPTLVEEQQGDDWASISDLPEFDIFKQYNTLQSAFDFWEAVMGYLELTGESFWILQRQGGRITEMYPVQPDLITVKTKNEFEVQRYEFQKNGAVLNIDPEDMFYLRYFNPVDPVRGLSPVQAAKNDIVLDLYAQSSSKATFEKGATPGGLISTKEELGDAEWKRNKQYIESEYSGSSNYGKIMFLTGGMTWTQMAMKNSDMQFMDQRAWSHKTVATVFGVPPIFFMDFSDASVLANADVQYRLLWETIKPKLKKIEAFITEHLLPQISSRPNIRFRFDLSAVAALQPDLTEKAKRFGEGFERAAVTPNQYRVEVLGLEPESNPLLDQYFLGSSLQPLDIASTPPAPPAPAPPTKEQKVLNTIDELRTRTRSLESIKKDSDDGKDPDAIRQEYYRTLLIDQGELFLTKMYSRDAVSFEKELKRLLDEQGREVVANAQHNKDLTLMGAIKDMGLKVMHKEHVVKDFKLLGIPEKLKYTVDGVSFNFEEWSAKYAAAGKPEMANALTTAGSELSTAMGETFNSTDPWAASVVEARSVEYAALVNTTTSNHINSLVAHAIEANSTVAELAASLESYFTAQNAMRAKRIARTELVSAGNAGREASMKQSKRVTHKRWMSMRDKNVRDSHAALDGTIAKKGEAFPGYTDGSSAEWPSSVNERCYVIPERVEPKE